jgi:hypothetical protein
MADMRSSRISLWLALLAALAAGGLMFAKLQIGSGAQAAQGPRSLPPIDREVPAAVETATFALG